MKANKMLTKREETDLIRFARDLVGTKSISGHEEAAIRLVEEQMHRLAYDEVAVDSMGNVLGRIGSGKQKVLLDAHVDTVDVPDAGDWEYAPFGGELAEGRIHGRGAVDMKSGAAAAVFAAAAARRMGLDKGKSVYVSCTVMEEDCDGMNLKHLFHEKNLLPHWVVICEPSNNRIALGHKGKAQVIIRTHGVSAHSAAPEKGVNAVYAMVPIIRRAEQLQDGLTRQAGPKASVSLSRISSTAASLNAVPAECEIYLDRRLAPGETRDAIQAEMERLIRGGNASWEFDSLRRRSWTGMEVGYEPFHEAWRIDPDHPLCRSCRSAYVDVFGAEPDGYVFWDFSTNAVTPVMMGIPTIGFGPGDPRLAHMRDENCPVEQIIDACRFYTCLIGRL